MNIDWQAVELEELAALVSGHLRKNGIEAVLVGGACVSLYSDNRYMSYDLDLVTVSPLKKIVPVLGELGFNNSGDRMFKHPRCRFILDFPAPPVSMGNEPVSRFNDLKTPYGTILMLTPTDCVKDRLAAWFFWNDPQSLEQALMVAERNKINLSEIRRWAVKQDATEKCAVFEKKLPREGNSKEVRTKSRTKRGRATQDR